MPKAAVCALTGQKFPLEGGGTVEKSWLHATDLAAAVHRIISEAPNGEIYNAGPARATSIRRIVELIAEETGVPLEDFVEFAPGRATEDQLYLLDSSKISSQLGWEPNIDLQTGVREMVGWAGQYLNDLLEAPQIFSLRS